jgi:methyltransferase (TIGR00027 family)
MTKAAAQTGLSPTALVAIEQFFPEDQRLIEDPWAYRILPLWARVFLFLMRLDPVRNWMIRTSEKAYPGIWSGLMCRKRYIDDTLLGSVTQIDEVVNLGAGFDTRALRLPALAALRVWEIDQPETVRTKQRRLQKLFDAVPDHIRLVPVDFDHEDPGSVLAANGYLAGRRTFFIWEAVTQYLTDAGIRETFRFLASAAPGSRLVFTYVRRDFLDGKMVYGADTLYEKFVVKDRLWIFGMDPASWPAFLEQYGWHLMEDVSYEELAERYVKPTVRVLASSPIERIVYAEKV